MKLVPALLRSYCVFISSEMCGKAFVGATKLVSFVGFVYSIDIDFYFKLIINTAAFLALLGIGYRVRRRGNELAAKAR